MTEYVTNIPVEKLKPFPNYPFQVRDDDSMRETVESIKTYGVLQPAIVRPSKDGDYEILSGHRRKHACELAGRKTIPAIVRELDDDAAIIFMVDSNLQRENILPSERAAAVNTVPDGFIRKNQQSPLPTAEKYDIIISSPIPPKGRQLNEQNLNRNSKLFSQRTPGNRNNRNAGQNNHKAEISYPFL